jgi:hypothetical protein
MTAFSGRLCGLFVGCVRQFMKTSGSILLLLSFVLIACMEESPTQAMLTLPNVEDILTYHEQYRDSIIAQTHSNVVIFHRDGGGFHVLLPPIQKQSTKFMLRSGEVETVKVHYFIPRCNKIVQELLLGVLTSVDFRQRP